MDVSSTPAPAEMLWWGPECRHRAARLMPQGDFVCSLTSGLLPVAILHIKRLAFNAK